MALLEAGKEPKPARSRRPAARRVAEALAADPRAAAKPEDEPPQLDAVLTVSERERLQSDGFRGDERRRDRRRASGDPPPGRCRSTCAAPGAAGPTSAGPRIDLRAHAARQPAPGRRDPAHRPRPPRSTRPPPLVVLCDISGSMARYAQILLHFLHAVTNDRDRVHVFLFGTRLTNITRQLRHRDPEVAFQMVAHVVPDWSGGTRIGEALEQFNRLWARRVLGQGAVVLLITDGLDRDGAKGLAENMDRLHRSCRRLIWLNPLLRWAGSNPNPRASARCCRTWTSSGPCTTWPACAR